MPYLGDVKCLDQHHPAGHNNHDERDDVHGAQDVENNVAWASQRLRSETHDEELRCNERGMVSWNISWVLTEEDVVDVRKVRVGRKD